MKEPTLTVCYVCQEEITAGAPRKYIYPIPVEPVDPLSAGYACAKCAPAEQQKQLDLGIHIDVDRKAQVFAHA